MNAIIALAIFELIQQRRFDRATMIDELIEMFNHKYHDQIYKIVDEIEKLDALFNY